MYIAFDPQTFSLQPYGGVSRYVVELATGLARLPDMRVSVLAFAHINAYLDSTTRGLVVGARLPVTVPEPLRPFLRYANQMRARHWLARRNAQIVHETYYSPLRSGPEGMPTVVTVHDMIHEKFPGYAPRTSRVARAKRAAIARADHLICVSGNTRRDVLEIYDLNPARVSVVHHGVRALAGVPDCGPRPLPEPYVLFVGRRGGYKDFEILLRAYAGARELARAHLLVCFGDAPLSAREERMIRSLGVPAERIVHATGDDARLATYYRHADLFVYPSRYEGFGMPPLEAMSQDCPVVCSNAASLPEVVGDAARLFEAGDVEALRAAMEAVLGSPALAASLRDRGRWRAAQFSWDECARQTRAVYEAVLGGHRSRIEQES